VDAAEVRSVTTLKSASFKFVSREFSVLYLAGTLGRHNSMTVGCYRYKCDDDGYFRLQRSKAALEIKQSEPHAMQTLCGSSRYNLRRLSGRRFEVTVSEDEDDPEMQEA
jgi:hypothetical protein